MSNVSPARIGGADPSLRRRQDLGQDCTDFFLGHPRANPRVVQDVEKILVVDVEEAHLDVVARF
jgi:hypothetical protein